LLPSGPAARLATANDMLLPVQQSAVHNAQISLR
jgi:hypothetical protein